MSDGAPLSNRAIAAIVAGSLVAGLLAMVMAVRSDREASPYNDVLQQTQLRADTLEHNNMILTQLLEDAEDERNECLAQTYDCSNVEPLPPDPKGLPPRTLTLNESVILDEIRVEAGGWEEEFESGEPPKTLGKADELRDYVGDPAPDGEVLPGPFAD